VSHELVRHRIASYSQESTRYCNYSKGKFGSELTFIRPYWDDRSIRAKMIRLRACWQEACLNAEWSYKKMIDAGCTPEAARAVLPNCLKTEVVMTANLREWRHFFKLRCAPAAHPDMRIIANMLLTAFKDVVPVVFDDIEGGQQHEEV
jgi:thymidylate synthase (FAD)